MRSLLFIEIIKYFSNKGKSIFMTNILTMNYVYAILNMSELSKYY